MVKIRQCLILGVILGLLVIRREAYAVELSVVKPLIFTVTPTKQKVKCGEAFEFLSLYVLPKDTYKTQEKWSYKPLFLEEDITIFEKPHRLFVPGKYKVTLQIKNNKEIWSEPETTYITVTKKCEQSEINYVAQNNIKGTKLNLFGSEDYRKYKRVVGVRDRVIPGKLMISNSPEKIKAKGILYEGVSREDGRLLIHHLHALTGSKDYRIVILATNLSENRQRLVINNWAIKGPSKDVLYIGEQLLLDYWDENIKEMVCDLPKGETAIIYKQSVPWQKGEALSAYMDFHTEDKMRWQVLCVENGDNFTQYDDYCVKDQHIRGTFETTKKIYHLDLEDEPSCFVIGQGKEEFLVGFDEIIKEEVYNKGNFGMEYKLHLNALKDTFVILNPRGDIFKGAIKWQGKVYAMPNVGCLRGKGEASFLGTVKEGEEVVLNYILPNGSSAPVLFVFVPKK